MEGRWDGGGTCQSNVPPFNPNQREQPPSLAPPPTLLLSSLHSLRPPQAAGITVATPPPSPGGVGDVDPPQVDALAAHDEEGGEAEQRDAAADHGQLGRLAGAQLQLLDDVAAQDDAHAGAGHDDHAWGGRESWLKPTRRPGPSRGRSQRRVKCQTQKSSAFTTFTSWTQRVPQRVPGSPGKTDPTPPAPGKGLNSGVM